VIALKGGSGKTTVATHLALAAHLRDVDVMLVDIDPQRSAQSVLSAREGGGPAYVASSGGELMAAKFAALGLGKQLLVIDTAAGAVEDVSEAIVLADLAVLVARPTLLDLAGLAPTLGIVRRLGKPAVVVVNQAPVAQETERAIAGLVPPWPQLLPPLVLERLVPDAVMRSALIAESPSVPLSYLSEPAPVLDVPSDLNASYVQLSTGYEAEAKVARECSWRVISLGGDHLWTLTHPRDVAHALRDAVSAIE